MFGGKSSKSTGKSNKMSSSGSIKKKAPPRPPPPKTDSAREDVRLYNHKLGRNQNTQCSYNIANRSDLIDLSTPPSSPPKFVHADVIRGGGKCGVPDFKYHIGASVFYLKSELKGSDSKNVTANPFSPPRPSAQSMLSTPTHSKSAVNPPLSTKYLCNPTIIKPHAQTTEAYSANGSSGQSSSNNDPWNNNNNASQYKNPNVPLTWDEPPKKITHIPPTVIRPVPPPKKPGLGTGRISKPIIPSPTSAPAPDPWAETSPPPMLTAAKVYDSTPRYDDPPDSEDEDDEFTSRPMPAEPPPPPPPELQFEVDYNSEFPQSPEQQMSGGENYSDSDHAYGIALYDYNSDEPGDLQFQAGDVIYLTRRVDESWLYGFSGTMEGMFPTNFVNVVVALQEAEQEEYYGTGDHDQAAYAETDYGTHVAQQQEYAQYYITVLHDFEGTERTDLTIRENDVVTVMGRINDEWLYGELNGSRGQFPTSFVALVPAGLPTIDLHSVGT